MSRLQGLKECDYQSKTRTCTCYTIRLDANSDFVDATARFVFDAIDDCGMVHGALYSCLRALFGLSVVGVLVAVISCMLVYQLLSHERKKMYWEQLELRCRSLYNGQLPPHGLATIGQAGAPIIDPNRCRCCEQCHAHGMQPTAAYPWHTESTGIRFWTGPAGNFYSPNPGGEDMRGGVGGSGCGMSGMTGSGIRNAGNRIPGSAGGTGGTGASTGWSWPRMPWQRNETATTTAAATRFRHPATVTPSSPDSQYGFSNNQGMMEGQGQMGNQPNGGYSVIGNAPYGVWGPPPPYSDPNSPARRGGTGGGGRYQYIQSPGGSNSGQCMQQQPQQTMIMAMHNDQSMGGSHSMNIGGQGQVGNVRQSQINVVECHHQQQQPTMSNQQMMMHQQCGHNSSTTEGPHSLELIYPSQQQQQQQNQHPHHPQQQNNGAMMGRNFGKQLQQKDFYENGNNNINSEDCGGDDGRGTINRGDTNSLPTRKTKKRVEAGAKSVGVNQPTPRVNVQDVFNGDSASVQQLPTILAQPRTTASGIELGRLADNSGTQGAPVTATTKIESNAPFQSQTKETESLLKNILEPAESEVYFGDVSSCCNVSVQQDNLYDETQEQHNGQQQPPRGVVLGEEDEEKDYLAQRFGNSSSTRSRMPFPQNNISSGQEDLSRKLIPPMVQPRKSLLLIQKEPSRHSMCSMDSDATEITDLSPNTPSVAMNLNEYHGNFEQASATATSNVGTVAGGSENFVASFPYSSTDHSQEAVRRPTPKVTQQQESSSPQYEVIQDVHAGNATVRLQKPAAFLGHHVGGGGVNQTTITTTGPQLQQQQAVMRSPKNSKVTPIKRRNISTDISTIIQNLNGSDVSLMYQDNRRETAAVVYSESGPNSGDNFDYNVQGREDDRL